jgi:hypothetical protein
MLLTTKSRENNDGRRYFDYCEITTTEYKWTTMEGYKQYIHITEVASK